MKKIVFRTFVYSFIFSTLVIFSVNKVQSCLLFKKQIDAEETNVKISGRNIVSFITDNRSSQEKEHYLVDNAHNETVDVIETEIADSTIDSDYTLFAEEDKDDNLEIVDNISEMERDIIAINDTDGTLFTEDFLFLDYVEYANLEQSDLFVTFENDKEKSIIEENRKGENIAIKKADSFIRDNTSKPAKVSDAKKEIIPIQNGKVKNNIPTSINAPISNNSFAMLKSDTAPKTLIGEDDKRNEETIDNNPWVVVKSSNPKNSLVLEKYGRENDGLVAGVLNTKPNKENKGVKVADIAKNILIPIPDDIIKEGSVVPRLVSSKRNEGLQEKVEKEMKEKGLLDNTATDAYENSGNEIENKTEEGESNSEDKKNKKTIFDSISSIFSHKTPEVGVSKNANKLKIFDTVTEVYTVKKKDNNKKDNKVTKILPTEIKLSFQPNRAEISGQTLKWLEAFANKTIEDKSVVLEVRIDGTSSFELQQKRLGMLHNILVSKGADYRKINTVFTTREPNSFIIRTVKTNDKSTAFDNSKSINVNSKSYQTW